MDPLITLEKQKCKCGTCCASNHVRETIFPRALCALHSPEKVLRVGLLVVPREKIIWRYNGLAKFISVRIRGVDPWKLISHRAHRSRLHKSKNNRNGVKKEVRRSTAGSSHCAARRLLSSRHGNRGSVTVSSAVATTEDTMS